MNIFDFLFENCDAERHIENVSSLPADASELANLILGNFSLGKQVFCTIWTGSS
jgi:hypothetical protein